MSDASADKTTSGNTLAEAFDETLVLDEQLIGLRGPMYKRSFSTARGEFNNTIIKLYHLNPKKSACVCFPSGMAAIGAVCSSLLKPGGVLVHGDELYSDVPRTFQYLCQQRPGTQPVTVNVRNNEALVKVFQEYGASIHVFHYESCTNPSGQMPDYSIFPKLRELAPNCKFVCDNTWLTAILFNPFVHGADIALESCTKYISGGTCIGGVACGSSASMDPVVKWSRVFGQFVPDT